jgi:acyl-CoA thioester hydrolase
MPEYPVVTTFPVFWGDMDALGHVNNARYFTWFETARIELARTVGLAATGQGSGPVLATTQCDYLRPVHYPGDVCVGVRVAAVGNTSITMEYAVWMKGAPETIHARGSSVLVLVDYGTMAKVRIPDAVRAALDAL